LATPSSSRSAMAAVIWSRIATITERPRKASRRPERHEARPSEASGTVCAGPTSAAPRAAAPPITKSQSAMALRRACFVQPDEIPERDGEALRRVEWIVAERVLETRHDEREAERVEAALQELQVIAERRELALLLPSNLLEESGNGGSHRHVGHSLVVILRARKARLMLYIRRERNGRRPQPLGRVYPQRD